MALPFTPFTKPHVKWARCDDGIVVTVVGIGWRDKRSGVFAWARHYTGDIPGGRAWSNAAWNRESVSLVTLVTLEKRGAGHGEKRVVLIWVLCFSYCSQDGGKKGHRGHHGMVREVVGLDRTHQQFNHIAPAGI